MDVGFGNLYSRILDVQITSKGFEKEDDFKLMLACDVLDVNRVDIFDVMHPSENIM